jgi:hypothetical protein
MTTVTAKLAYGLNNIRAQLKETSESRISCVAMMLNLVRLAWRAPYYLNNLMEVIVETIYRVIFAQGRRLGVSSVI